MRVIQATATITSSVSGTTTLFVQVASPVLSAPSGTYTSLSAVSITDATPGVTIDYQLSGSTNTNGFVVYTGPITVEGSGSLTIQAYGAESGYQQSANVSATYTLNLPPAPVPAFSLPSGSYPNTQTVTISDTDRKSTR